MFPSALSLMAGALFLAPTVLSDCGGPASSNAIPPGTSVTSYATPSGVSGESSYTSGATLVVESMSVVTVYASSQLSGYKNRGASPSYVPRQDTATTLIETMTVVPLPLSGNGLYTVTSGDYLYAIATANNIPLDSLNALNPTINPTLITPGQVINVRATGSLGARNPSHTGSSLEHSASNVQRQASCPAALATQPCPPTYTVASGDTFNSIATCCGITYEALEAMNTYSESGLSAGATVTIVPPNAGPNPPPVPAQPPAGNGLYTVASGDGLYDIASANSMPLASLSALNPNMNAIIAPGQVLTVRTPGPLQTTPPVPPQRRQNPAGNGVYTIQPNDARAQEENNAVIEARDDECPAQSGSTSTPASQPSSQASNPAATPPRAPSGSSPSMSMPCNPPSYTVMLGDTLYAIAQACGISLDALTSANNDLVATALQVGATLSIPSGVNVQAQAQTAAVAPVNSVAPSSVPGSSPSSSKSPAASTPAVSDNQYPNAVTPPAGYPTGDLYTSGGNKVRAAQSSSQVGSSPCADNTALNCIVIGPGTTHTHVPSSSATPLLSEAPCGPGGGMTCIVFNGQTLTLNKTSNTLQSMTSSLASSSSVSWINSTRTSNDITSSSASTLLTQTSSTTSKIATFSRSSSANNLKIPMWPLLLYLIGVTMAISSSSQATSSLSVSSTSSSVVISSIPTTLLTSTTSQTTALSSTATSSNNAWMWSILYELAKVSRTTKSSSTLVTTTQTSSSTGPLSTSANRTVSSSNSTSKSQNSTIAPSMTKRSASELQTSLTTSWPSATPCPDNTLALCEVIPARTFTRLGSPGNYSTHSYPRPTASPCPDQLSMGCIRMEHNTLSFVWLNNAAISGSDATAQSTTSSSASMTKRSLHELVTSTITSIPSPTLCADNKSYYCYTFGTQTVSSLTSLYNDTTFSHPLPTASPCPDESSKGCLSLGQKTLSFLWLNNATSLARGPSFASSAKKRQPPLTFSASAFPQPRPCPDNIFWECVDFGTSTYSFNPTTLPQVSPSTSEVGKSSESTTLSSTKTLTSTTTVPASKNESISAPPPTTTKTSAASKSLKLPPWILFLCSVRGVFAVPESSLPRMVSSTPSPKVIRLEPLTTVPASQSAAMKNLSPPSWLLLLLFFATCVFGLSKSILSSIAPVPTPEPLPIKPKSTPISILTSGSAPINRLPSLSIWLALPFFSFASFVLASVLEGSSSIDFEHSIPAADNAATRNSSFPIWLAPISLIGVIHALRGRLGTRSLITPGILFMILHTLVKPAFAQLTSSPSAMTNVKTSLTAGGYQYQGQGSWTGFVGVSTPGVGVVSLGGREESADGSSVGYSIAAFSVSNEPNAKSTISPRNMKQVVTMTHVSIDVATVAPTTINIVLTVTSSRPGTYSPASLPTTTAIQTASNKPTLGSWTYYGCFTESTLAGYGPSFRALNASVTYNYTSMTLELCAPLCQKYTFFGIEYGGECYYGDAFNNGSVKVQDAECSTPCPGNGAEWCGAGNRLSVYARNGSGTSVGSVVPVSSSSSAVTMQMGSSTSGSVSYEGVSSTFKTSPASKTSSGNVTITSESSVASAGMKLDISFLLMALGLGIYALAPCILKFGELPEESITKEEKAKEENFEEEKQKLETEPIEAIEVDMQKGKD